jgi:ribosome-associated GTPase EngA
VGRPNVGKSALFNRLVRKRQAIVRDTPLGHVTRDYQEGRAVLSDIPFLAIDTSGLEPHYPSDSIQMRATSLTRDVLQRSDVILFLLDGRDGLLSTDMILASWFRSAGGEIVDKILPVVNKCERSSMKGGAGHVMADVSRLGFEEQVAISAETGEGMADLYLSLARRLDPLLESRREALSSLGEGVDSNDTKQHPKVAIMGLTNVGKSTLMNRLLGQERCITGPEPGLTRDAISTTIKYGDNVIELIDTAGWIKKTQLKAHDDSDGAVAELTLREGKTVLRFVHVVVLVVDCSRVLERKIGFTHAEASLAADAVAQGRALIVCLNKVDVTDHASYQTVVDLVQQDLERVTPELGYGTLLPISALDGKGVGSILPAVTNVYKTWNTRIPTGKLNSWLQAETQQKLFSGGGKNIQRIKYLSQVKSRPPTFVAFVSGKASLDDSTKRFVANRLRDDFGLEGIPLRITVRTSRRK